MRRIRTHWDNCEEAHHECALAKLTAAQRTAEQSAQLAAELAVRNEELTVALRDLIDASDHAESCEWMTDNIVAAREEKRSMADCNCHLSEARAVLAKVTT